MKWKWLSDMAVLGALIGFIGTAEAGPVMDAPPGSGGGGGGGQINFGPGRSISLGSGYDNDFAGRGSSNGWANANGAILTTQMSSSFFFEPFGDPQPGNAGQLNVSISAQGDFIPDDGTITPAMRALSQNPLNTGGSFRINEVRTEQDGEVIIYTFDPGLQVLWYGNGSFYIDPGGIKHRGYLDTNVWLDGGAFTDVHPNFEMNQWLGEEPRPDWLSDWSANFSFFGLATPSSVQVVPEPASLALLGAGATAMIYRQRRLERYRLYKIG